MKPRLAFSLIEISISILVIAVLIALVAQGSRLFGKAVVNNARKATKNSIVAATPDLSFWFETTTDSSFDASKQSDGSAIDNWYNISQNNLVKKNSSQANSTHQPLFTKTAINGLPALKFNGSTSNIAFNASSLAGLNGYTIFLVDQSSCGDTSTCYLLGSSSTTAYSGVQLAYKNSYIYVDHNTSSLSVTSSSKVNSSESDAVPLATRVHSLTFSYDGANSNLNYYLNGTLFANTSYAGDGRLTNYSSAILGNASTNDKALNGYLGEVIVFNRKLTDEERQGVEAYLGRKWNSTQTVSNTINSSSSNSNNPSILCTFNGVAGIADGTTVHYAASGTQYCNAAGYTGSVGYSCVANGAPTVVGSYSLVTCTPSGVANFSTAPVTYGSTSSTACDTGYTGTIYYTCGIDGVFNYESGACNPVQCSTGIAGASTVNYNTTSRTCDSGYTGTISYTCSADGTFTYGSGSCSLIQCTLNNLAGFSGYLNGLVVGYIESGIMPCPRGYSGAINYQCLTSGSANVTSHNCSVAHGWVELSGISGIGVPPSTIVASPITCNSAYNNKYAMASMGIGVLSASGYTLQSTAANIITASCVKFQQWNFITGNCSQVQNYSTGSKVFQCIYP